MTNIDLDAQAVLQEELTALRAAIAANIRDKGLNASGRTIESMTIEVTLNEGQLQGTLYGRPYFKNLETGNKPWAKQYPSPPRFFVKIIDDWAKVKGIDINSWLTARKIMREGTKTFREGGRQDIFTPPIEQTVDNIGRRLAGLFTTAITTILQ